jgi:hypothetical protein
MSGKSWLMKHRVAAVHRGMKIWTMTFAIKSHNGMTLKFKLMSQDARAVSADVPSASRCSIIFFIKYM